MFRFVKHTSLVAALLTSTLGVAQADVATDDASWQFDGAVYLWGAGIGATTAAGDDIDISFSDLVENLDMAFMGVLQARRGKWSLLADVIYLNVSASETSTAKLINRPVTANLDVALRSWVVTAAGAYAVKETDTTRVDLLAGGRYLYLKSDIEFQISAGSPFGPWQQSVKESGDIVDAIVGVRGRTALGDKWYLNYLADIGAGGSDLTWQALAGLNYRYSKVDAAFGYRYLKWELDNDTFDEMAISGPYAGVRFSF
jgi:hypothetical protein